MMNNSAENTGLKINNETIDEMNNNSPIRYGKFNSLTLINWNGFFARTFELDQLVTTLSGGNGAGKSTTMAGFVTALIPDLTLLHFRNTTEAGATGGSRDKGLYGKLKPGICYSLLDVINSKNQRIICGVRLQQIAGRDKKVDIKPFILQGLEKNLPLTEVITERLDERKARVLSLAEIKERIESFDGVIFKQFNSISDYHSMMFDFGVLPKRLRSSSDRSKYYRLIEASLYGGISSAITKSLRDYLLPENTGVRKAFQDMESALRENRMTLEAIRVTQSDRDLFKHLITESTHYVSADYMRHSNQRMNQIETLLGLRKSLFSTKKELFSNQNNYVETAESLQEKSKVQADLDVDFQSANDYLNLVQTAFRQQEKIDNYQIDVDELREKIFEQTEIVEQANEQYLAYQDTVDGTEKDVDEIKTQLSDYQQALDAKQTRTVQYQQALQALDNARKLCNLPNLTAENAQEELAIFNEKELEVTETVLQLEQKLSVANAAVNQFDQAYRLVVKLVGEVARSDAWKMAKQVLKDWASHSYQSEKVDQLQWQFNELEQRLSEQKEAEILLASFNKKIGYSVDYDDLDELKETLSAKLDESNNIADENNEKRLTLKQEFEQIDIQIQQYRQKTPIWLKAQDELNDLRDKLDLSLSSSQEVTEAMQSLLEKEREIATKRDQIVSKREQLNQKINQLNQPNGADDSRLNSLAEHFNGVLLSEIYEDVTIDDAPYFSALYGPARHAIVVPDLASVKEQLNNLTDCPDDLYFIEGDASSFDASVFNSEELNQAVLVKTSDRQCRYSRFPELPLFGRAAREKHLDTLIQMRDELNEQYAIFSFDLQKLQRVEKNVSQFIGQYLAVAFDINPESEVQRLSAKRNEIERELQSVVQLIQQNQQKILELRDQLVELNKLLSSIHLLADDGLADRTNEIEDALIQAKNSASYVKQNQNIIAELEPLVNLLQSDPNQHETLRQQFDDITAKQREIKKQIFALKEVIQRRSHFNYTDSVSMEESNTDLTSELRHRLEKAEKARSDAKERMRYYQEQYHQYNGTLMSLKSAFDTKNDVLNDLKKEVSEMGVKVDAIVAEKARLRRDDLHHQITENRQLCSSLEKKLTVLNSEISQLQRKLKQIEKDYKIQREQVVEIKKGWCLILRTVKENGIERRLNRRELAYLSSDELRSMSDKALGALRLAVSNNEHLRDVLRLSEDIKRPERKIQFYLAVYQHLRERIRQDIVKTDDPIEAIEQMEIELSRLTEELTSREQQLAISAKSVSNIIRKTIQREENRIRMLNQGLQSVSFGQVNGVRLNVTIREAHSILLEALSAQNDDHQDLFDNSRMTFSEALAKLYQRLNPHVEMGQRSAQNIGEELLDYRNYLDLDIEVHRGADGWLRAESGALSTGEAIGTGMSILLMVIQSWEEESKRLRNKDILPCRLLFLDEAARLDAKSIATLFELCEKLEMQLIIAAPENISPEKGTTYKLVRKVVNNNEFVHVVGLKGFA